jgi:hypothetical protein
MAARGLPAVVVVMVPMAMVVMVMPAPSMGHGRTAEHAGEDGRKNYSAQHKAVLLVCLFSESTRRLFGRLRSPDVL